MRLLGSVLALSAALIGFSQAASLAELAAQIPACGLLCLETAISASSCTLANSTCICTNIPLLTSAAACLGTSCTVKEQLKVAKIQEEGCGEPVKSEQLKLRIITHVFCVLAEACIILRIWTKLQLARKLHYDDWSIIGSGFALIPFWYLLVALANQGLGLNMWDTDIDDLDHFFQSEPLNSNPDSLLTVSYKLFYIEEIIYILMLAITKVALLLFLVKIFPSKSFRAACWTVGAITVAVAITFVLVTVFSCRPISHFWTQWQGISKGKCNNINLQTIVSGVINIVQDFTILFLPLPELYKLQVSMQRKIQLFMMFGVGLFVSIISIIRLRSLISYSQDYTSLVIWSTVEPTAAIMCACMPSIRQLLGHFASGGFFNSTIKTNPASGVNSRTPADQRIYQSRSFKIESKLRNQNDDFHELTSMHDTSSNAHLDQASGKSNSLTKHGSEGAFDGHDDEHKQAAHVWTPTH
ncbi:Satratoxin biosynthesis SC1 cluster protein [Lachnellula subtilissima]|uniref:Satratoxin biosynthesis SC1 cluster protein n=1 Tax=Lachnellula subtilissima TaxID=602034 RepID=A0A8H8S1Z6_9HELO|nr:Satratoxin biosynthesis SC1 cluster protein [Lachnellula subtilissima]